LDWKPRFQFRGKVKMNGKIKWYNYKKGFGFIVGEDGKEYFIHYSQVPQGTKLYEEDAITFDAVDTDKGVQAQNLQVVGSAKKNPAPAQKEEATQEIQEEPEVKEAPEDSEDF